MLLDPISTSILLGVVSNGICSSIGFLRKKGVDLVKEKNAVQEQLEANESLTQAMQRALADASAYASLQDAAKTFKLKLFLQSQEVENIVRQVFASHLLGEQTDLTARQSAMREEFHNLLCLRR